MAKKITPTIENKANKTHTHAISDITNLQTTLDNKQAKGSYVDLSSTQTVTGKKTFTGTIVPSLIQMASLNAQIQNGVIDTHPESSKTVISYFENDLAGLLYQGGTCSVTGTKTTISDSVKNNWFDGTTSYGSFTVSATTDTVVITIYSPTTYYYGQTVGIGFGSATWRAKSIKIEMGYSSDKTEANCKWVTRASTTSNAYGVYQASANGLTASEGGASNNPWNFIRFTLTSWNTTTPRIAGIWAINYSSAMLGTGLLPRKGGTMFGSITPMKTGSFNLGSSSLKWNQIHGTTLYENGTALSSKYQAKGNYAASSHTHTISDITDLTEATSSALGLVKVDTAMSTTSTNPVQNKVVNTYIASVNTTATLAQNKANTNADDIATLKTSKQDVISDLATIRSNASAVSSKANDSDVVHLSGDTMTGQLTAPILSTGTASANYFQTQKMRGEGTASTYYHAVDWGYSGHNQVDFYEYGGTWNFNKCTSGSSSDITSILSITPSDLTYLSKHVFYTGDLNNSTKASYASTYTAPTSTSRLYSVQLDSNGKLAVYVPWINSDSNTQIRVNNDAGTGNGNGGNVDVTRVKYDTPILVGEDIEAGSIIFADRLGVYYQIKSGNRGRCFDPKYPILYTENSLVANVKTYSDNIETIWTFARIKDLLIDDDPNHYSLWLFKDFEAVSDIGKTYPVINCGTSSIDQYTGKYYLVCESNIAYQRIYAVMNEDELLQSSLDDSYYIYPFLYQRYSALEGKYHQVMNSTTNLACYRLMNGKELNGTPLAGQLIPNELYVSPSITNLEDLIADKQDTLTSSQLTAVNSGITSTLVSQISTNTTNISKKATVTLNGSSTTSPSFYAPTSAGTSNYILKSNGSGAPTWTNYPTFSGATINGAINMYTTSYQGSGLKFASNYTITNMETGSATTASLGTSLGAEVSVDVTLHNYSKGSGTWHFFAFPEGSCGNNVSVGTYANLVSSGFRIFVRNVCTTGLTSARTLKIHWLAVKYY